MSKIARILATACIVPFAASIASAALPISDTIYVRTTGSDANPGTSASPKLTIQAAINAAGAGKYVNIGAGTFTENVTINKKLKVTGAGVTTIIKGVMGSAVSTVTIDADSVTLEKVYVTRDGNAYANWYMTLSTSGVYLYGRNYVTIQDSKFDGNRTALRIDDAQNVSILRNVIDNNRLGIELLNDVSNANIANNEITNNWTLGIHIFNDVAAEQTTAVTVTDNKISGNWYGALRSDISNQANTAAYNFSRNYLGATVPTYMSSASDEPSYELLIPAVYGGSSTSPGTYAGYVYGDQSAKLDVTPMYGSGTDASGSAGWQGNTNALYVDDAGAQTGSTGRISEAVAAAAADGTVWVNDGTYTDNVVISKKLKLFSVNGKAVTTIDGDNSSSELGTVVFSGTINGAKLGQAGNGFTILGTNGTVGNEKAAVYFNGNGLSNINVNSNTITARGDGAVLGQFNQTISKITIQNNEINGATFTGDNPAGLGLTAEATLDNVPRHLVRFGGGAGSGGAKSFTFSNNIISGIAGGMSLSDNSGSPISAVEQGNYLVTLDLGGNIIEGSTIENNTFSGSTAGSTSGALRTRGNITIQTVGDNTFNGTYPINYFSGSSSGTTNALRALLAFGGNTFAKGAYASSTGTIFTTIQAAIGLASDGATVTVTSGYYPESPVVDKRITLDGAGDDTTGTIVHGGITVDASGSNFLQRTTVKEMRVVGSTGNGITINAGKKFISVDNISTAYHNGDGVRIEGGAAATDILFTKVDATDNAGRGYFLNGSMNLDKLTLNNSEVLRNGRSGFTTDDTTNTLSSVLFNNVHFQNNGHIDVSNGLPSVDVAFLFVNGSISLVDVDIESNNSVAGLAFAGNPLSMAPAGTINLTDVDIKGTFSTPDTTFMNEFTGAGLAVLYYSNVANVNFGLVKVNATTGHALTVAGIDGTLSLSSTTSLVADNGMYVYAMAIPNLPTTGVVDARNAKFNGVTPSTAPISTLFGFADRVIDRVDAYSDSLQRSYVKLKNNNVYVTPNSHILPESHAQIQRGIDAASDGNTVHARIGDYGMQVATDRYILEADSSIPGPYQFGLFINKNNLTVKGHGVGDADITWAGDAAVRFTTNATNGFGYSGIWVEGNGVTLTGLNIGDNYDEPDSIYNNKVIEVVGDAFTINYSQLNQTNTDNGGAIYIHEWSYPRFLAGTVRSYDISNNWFYSASISINNGAGTQGDVSGRKIQYNTLTGTTKLPGDFYISFRGWSGADPAIPYVKWPVGGASVLGNAFGDDVENLIIARGNEGGYIESDMDWASMWTGNNFQRHTVDVETEVPFTVRPFTSSTGFDNSRRIASRIQSALNSSQNNDVVLVGNQGYYRYNENPILVDSTVIVKNLDTAMLGEGNYFIFGAWGLGDANFPNWNDAATFGELGVNADGSLQEAANYVNPMGTLHVLDGTYALTTPVTIDSGITVLGNEPDSGSTDCDLSSTLGAKISTTSGRIFDVVSSSNITMKNLALSIATDTAGRFMRLTSSGNVSTEEMAFVRGGIRLFGTNNTTPAAGDITKYIQDGWDAGYGPGKVTFGAGVVMPMTSVAAAWKGEDGAAGAAGIATLPDYAASTTPLNQTTPTRRATRMEVDGKLVMNTIATKYVSANVNATVHGGQQRTVFVAFKTGSALAPAVIYKHGDVTNGISVWTTGSGTTGNAGINLMVNGTNVYKTWACTTNTWYVAQVYFNGNDTAHRVGMNLAGVSTEEPAYWNSTSVTPATLITPATGTNTSISLGARQGYTRRENANLNANALGDPFVGNIGEVVILSTADDEIRNGVYCVLSGKWNAGSTTNELEKDEIPAYAGATYEPSISNAYPNPANDEVNFDVVPAATEEIRISIVNTMGQQVANLYQGVAQAGVILPMAAEVSGLTAGAYMIVVTGENTHFATPVMVRH